MLHAVAAAYSPRQMRDPKIGEILVQPDDLKQRVRTLGQEVTVFGRLRSVEFCPSDAAASLEAELFDGTEGVTLIWMGRRRIPGIEPGRTMRVRGRLALREGRKVLYHPFYEICQAQ